MFKIVVIFCPYLEGRLREYLSIFSLHLIKSVKLVFEKFSFTAFRVLHGKAF